MSKVARRGLLLSYDDATKTATLYEQASKTEVKVPMTLPTNRPPTPPGEVLRIEFLEPRGISQVALAEALEIPIQRINTLVKGKRGMSAETALLLASYFDTTPEFWMQLQNACDLFDARKRLDAHPVMREEPALDSLRRARARAAWAKKAVKTRKEGRV